ncbi:MAG: cache domain-containing protein, partial [Syntrophales bacterium LBB04]|nr:cache domain-containing protein [Syntrophales bacterium LBB04]
MKKKRRGLAFRLSFLILLSTAFIYFTSLGYDYYDSRGIVLKNIEISARNLTRATVYQVENILRGVVEGPRHIAASLEDSIHSRPELLKQIKRNVSLNPEIFASAVAFEPYVYDRSRFYFCPYYSRENDRLKLSFLGNPYYHYFSHDWYLVPKELDRPIWSEPYFDKGGGNIVMCTYSVPFHRNAGGNRKFIGVV